jgi:hypothetical protein
MVGNDKFFMLAAELVYQGGSNNPQFNPIIKAVKDRNYPAAKAALEATLAWRVAGDSKRRKHYSDSLKQSME